MHVDLLPTCVMPPSSDRAEVERENVLDAVGGIQYGKALQNCIREFRNSTSIVIETSGAYLNGISRPMALK